MPQATVINYEAIRGKVMRAGRDGLEEALEELKNRAKERAPVRNVFGAKASKNRDRVPRGVFTRNGQVFGRRILHHQDAGRDRFLAQANASRTRNTRIVRAGKRIEGSARGFHPLVRSRDAQGRLKPGHTTGDFRRAVVSGGQVRLDSVRANTGGAVNPTITGDRFLTSRGRGELRRANKIARQAKAAGLNDLDLARELRGASLSLRRHDGEKRPLSKAQVAIRKTALHVGELGDTALGGRLRDEIYVGEITEAGDVISGEVIAPTEYAKYQEYGTSHNRAQPFMRPSLYEMRSRFRTIVQRSVRREFA